MNAANETPMTDEEVTLSSLTSKGRRLYSVSDTCRAHRDFEYWVNGVANWLDQTYPNTGFSAQWSGLPFSRLVVGNHYDSSGLARADFTKVVGLRLTWLGELGQTISEAKKPDSKESDAVFTAIDLLLKGSFLPQLFKSVIQKDIADAQKSYSAEAYKSCVVMLGAALEGVMLGTLQRTDVITYLAMSANVPGPIKKLGTKDPALSDKIGIQLTFEDYKVCIHELIPGTNSLGVDNIQDFRNAIHPWKSIQEPLKYGDFDRPRALHYLASFQKICEALLNWKP